MPTGTLFLYRKYNLNKQDQRAVHLLIVDAPQMPREAPADYLQGIKGWPADASPRLFFLLKLAGHLQGIWRWPADATFRLVPCKNRPMPEKL